MPVKGDFCHINGFVPSSRTIEAIKDMNNVITMTNYLEQILSAVPFFQIFAGRKTYGWTTLTAKGWQLKTQDWQVFSDAMKAVPAIKKNRLELIASTALLYSTGNDQKFWKCVYNGL